MASPERRQEQLPAEVLGLGLVVREVGVDELLGVGQEEVLGHGGGARGAHRVHQPPVALQLHRAPVVQPAAGRGEPRTWGVVGGRVFCYEKCQRNFAPQPEPTSATHQYRSLRMSVQI